MKNTPEEEALLIEAVTSAHRPATATGELGVHPAWVDLDDAGRDRAFEATRLARRLEAALDPEGLSTTARAVLARITRA
jgi:hypothetical protein